MLTALSALDLAEVVPHEYRAYAPVLRDALWLFLQRLPGRRLGGIVEEQARLPQATGVALRLVALMHHCPTLHKLGQVLARDHRLAIALRRQLQTMESLEPRTPLADIQRIVAAELGDEAGACRLAPAALAEGSVAVVIPFTGPHDGGKAPARDAGSEPSIAPVDEHLPGVLKVLRAGVAERLAEELAIWPQVADFVAERCAELGTPVLEVRDTFQTVRDLLEHEVRLDRERVHIQEAATQLAHVTSVVVPRPLTWATPRLLSMERLDDRKVTDNADLSPAQRHRVARALVEALVMRPWTSSTPDVLFHADPHAGNLLLQDDGRVALVDWSLTGRLGKDDRVALTRILMGALTHDAGRIHAGVRELADSDVDEPRIEAAVDAALRRLRQGTRPGMAWLTALLDDVITTNAARLGPGPVLFRKTLYTLEGVLEDVCGPTVLEDTMMASLVANLVAEWPQRLGCDVASRAWGSHVSSLDLLSAFWGTPAALMRSFAARWDDEARSR